MDLEMGLAVLGVVAVTAAAVYLVSVMGIKEKSFEEAIAEQKKRSEDLLGRRDTKKKVTVKDKSKKQKKAKEKEKHQVPLGGDLTASGDDGVDTSVPHQHHHDERHHVEIDPEPEILDDLHLSESRRASVVRMRESLKSILINKEEHSPIDESEPEPANHFEDIQPKDDLELLKTQNSYDESPPQTPPPPLPQRQLKKSKVEVKNKEELSGFVEIPSQPTLESSGYYENVPAVEEIIEVTQVESLKTQRSGSPEDGQYDSLKLAEKSSRSKKNKQQQQDRDEMNAAKLESTIDRVPLSSSEIQNLIDILLNKQHAGDSEWINKGKNDSVGNLKKQLADRERQLNEEQVTVQTLQNKLKDIRQEFTSEKSKFSQIRRQLEETANQKVQDVQQLQVRLQQLRQEVIGEKQVLQQKLQQMQITLNQLRDENVAVKGALSLEQANRGKADSLEREAEALRTQCGHLENQLKAAFQSNQELSNQIRNLQEHLRALEERKNQEEHNLHTQYAAQIQEREAHLLTEIKKTQDLLTEAEQEKINLRQQNSNLQNSVRNSQETAKALEEVNKKLEDSINSEKNTKNLLEDSKNQIGALQTQLQDKESQVQKLDEERKKLLEQVTTLTERQVASEKEKVNGDIKNQDQESNEDKVNKSQLTQLQTQLNEKDGLLQELNKTNSQLTNEIEKTAQNLQAQKDKNDELRLKNTKLMDTLSVTEKNLEVRIVQSEVLVQEERTKSRVEVEDSVKSSIRKLFPQLSADLNQSDWIDQFAKGIQEEIQAAKPSAQPTSINDSTSSLELQNLKEVNTRLQDEVSHYQDVLCSTETLLSNLQGSIEKEERKWHQKLQQKEAELNVLKGQTPSANSEVSNMKTLLDEEREEKSVLSQRCSELENNIQNLKKQFEQVDLLKTKLEILEGEMADERRKGTELATEKSRLESAVVKEQESCQAEKEKVSQLLSEITLLKKHVTTDGPVDASVISASATSNGVANGKSVDLSGQLESVVKTGGGSSPTATTPLASPHASTSSTTTTTSSAPAPKATNAETPVSSKESKPKKKKTTSADVNEEKGTTIVSTLSGASSEKNAESLTATAPAEEILEIENIDKGSVCEK